MSNISIKINLALLKAVRRTEKGQLGPVECLILPIKNNHLYEGKDGALYLDMTAFELKTKKEGQKDTHLVKQQLPADVFKAMTDEQKKSTPILGNCIVWEGERGPNSSAGETAPTIGELDNLPF